jgi:hypothetical protein
LCSEIKKSKSRFFVASTPQGEGNSTLALAGFAISQATARSQTQFSKEHIKGTKVWNISFKIRALPDPCDDH